MAKKQQTVVVESAPAVANIGIAVISVINAILDVLKGEKTLGSEPTIEIGGTKYISGSGLFRLLGLATQKDRLESQHTIDGVVNGTLSAGIDKTKWSQVAEMFRTRYGTKVCYRPNFKWSAPKVGEKKMTFGLGDDWAKFYGLWNESIKLHGTPNPAWVAVQYGNDEYGAIMSESYALHIAKQAKENGLDITLPEKKGRGRRKDVPAIADVSLKVDDVINNLLNK